jgi:hypothetical protein
MAEMTKDEMRARVAEINEKIASARSWGALLTALNEERNGLMRALTRLPVSR